MNPTSNSSIEMTRSKRQKKGKGKSSQLSPVLFPELEVETVAEQKPKAKRKPKVKAKVKAKSPAKPTVVPPTLHQVLNAGKKSPLLWALPEKLATPELVELIEAWHNATIASKLPDDCWVSRLVDWVAAIQDFRPDAESLPEALTYLYSFEVIEKELSSEISKRLLAGLHTINKESYPPQGHYEPLVRSWLDVELRMLLGRFADSNSKSLLNQAIKNLAALLDSVLSECELAAVPPDCQRSLLASSTRSLAIYLSIVEKLPKGRLLKNLKNLLLSALRICRSDRHSLLASEGVWDWSKRCFELAASLINDDAVTALLSISAGIGKKPAGYSLDDLPVPSVHSSTQRLAILRAGWFSQSPKLLVDYSGDLVRVELDSSQSLMKGNWLLSVAINGRPIELAGEWEEVCWHEDEDVAYLELERWIAKGVRVQRQFVLARGDLFLLVGDAILTDKDCVEPVERIEYRSSLPLADNLTCVQADETREAYLDGEKRLGAILPISLPEWKTQSTNQELTINGEGLFCSATDTATATYFPLFLDLNPVRCQSPLTWRQLRVAEQREIVSRSIAVGYRAQVGQEQWLFYRTLSAPGNRTVLGQNLVCDFLAAQFDADGQTTEIVRINTQDDE